MCALHIWRTLLLKSSLDVTLRGVHDVLSWFAGGTRCQGAAVPE